MPETVCVLNPEDTLADASARLASFDVFERMDALRELSEIGTDGALGPVLGAFQAYSPSDPEYRVAIDSLARLCETHSYRAPAVASRMIDIVASRAAHGTIDASDELSGKTISAISDIIKGSDQSVDAALTRWQNASIDQLKAVPSEATLLPFGTKISDPVAQKWAALTNSVQLLVSLATRIDSAAATEALCQVLSELHPGQFGISVVTMVSARTNLPEVLDALQSLQSRWSAQTQDRGTAVNDSLRVVEDAIKEAKSTALTP